jgi:hypothetical protein
MIFNIKWLLFEKVLFIYLSLLSILIIAFSIPFSCFYKFLLINLLFTTIIFATAYYSQNNSNKYTKFFRYWLPVFLFTFLYEETGFLIHLIHPSWFDSFFSSMDIKIFSVNLGLFVEQFDNRLLNELFRIGYGSYYLIILSGLFIHYFWGRISEYEIMLSKITTAFCISYLLFIILPTQGPRFYHESIFHTNMDGLLFSYIQQKIMQLGSFRGGAFPSSHIAVALIVWWSLFSNHRKYFNMMGFFMFLLIMGTIWARYHYAIDALAGILLAILVEIGFNKYERFNQYRKKNN